MLVWDGSPWSYNLNTVYRCTRGYVRYRWHVKTRRSRRKEGQGGPAFIACQALKAANHDSSVSKSCKRNSSFRKHNQLESRIDDIMERRNAAFQKVYNATFTVVMMLFLPCVAQTNLHRPQPGDPSVCGQQQKCRQHYQISRNIIADSRRDHDTTGHFRSQTRRLCLLPHLTGPQSESGSSSSSHGSMSAMSLYPDLARLDDKD